MAKLYNLARMTSATTGTGTLTLGAAVSGYLSFDDAGVQNSDVVTYAIVDGTSREIGRGVYTTSGATLTRAVIYESTNGGSAINYSGSGHVMITFAAEDIRFHGARVKKSVDQTAANYTTETAVAFDAEDFDTDNIHDNSVDNTKFVIPSGMGGYWKFGAFIRTQLAAQDVSRGASIRVDGTTYIGRNANMKADSTDTIVEVSSGPVFLAAGQYVEFMHQTETDTSITVVAAETRFWCEYLGN